MIIVVVLVVVVPYSNFAAVTTAATALLMSPFTSRLQVAEIQKSLGVTPRGSIKAEGVRQVRLYKELQSTRLGIIFHQNTPAEVSARRRDLDLGCSPRPPPPPQSNRVLSTSLPPWLSLLSSHPWPHLNPAPSRPTRAALVPHIAYFSRQPRSPCATHAQSPPSDGAVLSHLPPPPHPSQLGDVSSDQTPRANGQQPVVIPVIKVLDKSGIAGNAANLFEGDQVLSVNGKAALSNIQAVQMLREAVGEVMLAVRETPLSKTPRNNGQSQGFGSGLRPLAQQK